MRKSSDGTTHCARMGCKHRNMSNERGCSCVVPRMRGMWIRRAWDLLGEGVNAFIDDEALTRGAAIAFYAATAIAPTLFIAITIASFGFGRDAARSAIASQLSHLMGHESAALLQLAIRNAQGTSTGIISGIIGVLTLILTASGVFGEMEDALNVIWRGRGAGRVPRRACAGRGVR